MAGAGARQSRYSLRSASMASTFVARRAGSTQAASPEPSSASESCHVPAQTGVRPEPAVGFPGEPPGHPVPPPPRRWLEEAPASRTHMTIGNCSVLVVGPVVFIVASLAVPRAQPAARARLPRSSPCHPGFEVELVAGPPLVDRPIVADFDERGPALRRRLVRLERQGGEAARREAAPHRAARGHRRRRPLRQAAPSSPTG